MKGTKRWPKKVFYNNGSGDNVCSSTLPSNLSKRPLSSFLLEVKHELIGLQGSRLKLNLIGTLMELRNQTVKSVLLNLIKVT